MLDKEIVKEMYLNGYNANQIANSLNCKSDTVRQCIHRNLKEFRNSHLHEKIRRKEVDRITRRECKQWMSDKDFVKRNRSIYKTKENGDIVVKPEFKNILPFDVPRSLINEDKCII